MNKRLRNQGRRNIHQLLYVDYYVLKIIITNIRGRIQGRVKGASGRKANIWLLEKNCKNVHIFLFQLIKTIVAFEGCAGYTEEDIRSRHLMYGQSLTFLTLVLMGVGVESTPPTF